MEYRGPLYRALHPRFAADPLSGEGARRYGSRFNRPGRAALYLARDFDTLRHEIARGGRFQPSVVLEFDAILSGLFDAADPTGLAAYDIDAQALAGDGWRRAMMAGQVAPTQDFAEALIADGATGLVVPSHARGARPEARNLVLWVWGDGPPNRLVPIDPEGRLSRDGGGAPS